MGVRGLTSFIARNAELYLTPYELHDCNLVIDGDNLACNLYKDVTGSCSAFGGDYDCYYRAVLEFFHVLAECKITALVLMDGGYEQRKLRTVGKRLRGKISVIKKINPCGSITVFPLLMKEVFVDALRDCGIPVMRCVFEADDELAALSRKLNCPVLSYDSDFYIHNVRYIPLVTLTVKAHTKRWNEEEQEESSRRLRKNEARHVEKRTKSSRILSAIQVDNVEKRAPKGGKTYKYLDCCMYRIENLIARGSLNKEKLPLFAALLGNDYIARSSFKNFFNGGGMGKIGRSRKLKQQQKRIKIILQWLKHETLESALEKIMARLKLNQRTSLLAQVQAATSGYSNELCHSYDYLVQQYENFFKEHMFHLEDEEENFDDVVEEEEEEESGISDDEINEDEELSENDATDLANPEINDDLANPDEIDDDLESVNSGGEEEESDDDVEDKTKQFPAWFLAKLYPANLPRFFVDLMHLKKYINNPQIEHFPHNDCHEVALPILIYIYTLLNRVEGAEAQPQFAEDGTTELPIEFTYLTRATRVSNIRHYRFPIEEQPLKYAFNPDTPNPLLLRHIFESNMKDFDAGELFEKLNLLPPDLRVYFLAIVYWLQKSQHCDLRHLHALILCAVVLRTIDAKIPAERDLKAFQKRFGKIVKKERLVRDKDQLEGVQRSVRPELQSLSIAERIEFVPKSDCYLVQDQLLKHFHMQEIFKKKYDLYSTTVLHAFAEFQSIVFQLHSLNALLDMPFASPRLGGLYCGVFLYNIYDLLHTRLDIRYFVQHFIFRDSPLMFNFYCYLFEWCEGFLPQWKREQANAGVPQSLNKKTLKKQRQAARKQADSAKEKSSGDPNAEMVDSDADEFFDLNNKFCTFLKIS